MKFLNFYNFSNLQCQRSDVTRTQEFRNQLWRNFNLRGNLFLKLKFIRSYINHAIYGLMPFKIWVNLELRYALEMRTLSVQPDSF